MDFNRAIPINAQTTRGHLALQIAKLIMTYVSVRYLFTLLIEHRSDSPCRKFPLRHQTLQLPNGASVLVISVLNTFTSLQCSAFTQTPSKLFFTCNSVECLIFLWTLSRAIHISSHVSTCSIPFPVLFMPLCTIYTPCIPSNSQLPRSIACLNP